MSYEQAVDLFYNNEKVRDQFNYWEIDHAIAIMNTFISDVEKIVREKNYD